MSARKNKSDDGNISQRCQTANLIQNLRQGTADGWRKHDGDAQSHAHGGVLAHAVAAVGRPSPPQRAVLLTPHPALTERMRRMECAATHASRYQSSCSSDEIWYPDFDRIITFDIRICEKFDINIPSQYPCDLPCEASPANHWPARPRAQRTNP